LRGAFIGPDPSRQFVWIVVNGATNPYVWRTSIFLVPPLQRPHADAQDRSGVFLREQWSIVYDDFVARGWHVRIGDYRRHEGG
jgi:hypothetical protein